MPNRHSMTSDHRRHDWLLIARFAVGDSFAAELDEARQLVAACAACAGLAEDVRALSRAVGELPAASRTRDYRLTPEQADALRGTWFERLMRRLGSGPAWGTVRPLASVAISLGLVLAVVGALPLGMAATGTTDQEVMMLEQPGEVAATQGPIVADGPPEGAPAAGDDGDPGSAFGPESSPSRAAADPLSDAYLEPINESGEPVQRSAVGDDAGGAPQSALLYGGLGTALLGFGALAAVWLARRRFADPLLR